MTSKIQEKLSKTMDKIQPAARARRRDEKTDIKSAKYLLRVTAGPSYDETTHQPVAVNSGQATQFENRLMRSSIKVRVRNYRGLPLDAPATSAYFDHPRRRGEQYSIGFSFVPKLDLDSVDALWGNDFDDPIRDRLPPGFNLAVRIVKEFVDPGITCDAYADQPWLYAPSISSFYILRIGEKKAFHEWGEELPHDEDDDVLQEGADGSGQAIRDELNLPETGSKRRKHFLSAANRQAFKFEAGRLYQVDFFNPYIDFSTFSLRLPGFSIGVLRYVNDKTHKLRYVFKDGATGELFFCVNFILLFGEELQEALREEEERWERIELSDGETVAGAENQNGEGSDGELVQGTVRGESL